MRRRNFLLGTTSGLAVVANADHVFARALAQPVRSAVEGPLPGLPGGADRCLVLINLSGGNDGFNWVFPTETIATISCAQRWQSTATTFLRSTQTWGSTRGCNPSRHSTIKAWSRSFKAWDIPIPITRIFARRRFGRLLRRIVTNTRVGLGATSTKPDPRARICSKAWPFQKYCPKR